MARVEVITGRERRRRWTERLARYEVHLDRKLERMLAMLFKLQELCGA